MIVGILREPNHDKRVSLLPEQAKSLIKNNTRVLAEAGAGAAAFAADEAYVASGVAIASRDEILQQSDLILAIQPLTANDLTKLKSGTVVIGVYQPLFTAPLMQDWARAQLTTFSLDMIPRTTRAQSMDVLSSQANIAGYRAVLLAATLYPRYFPMFMTAAGSITPARVLVLGAGVAGLQAVATARRLGAVVEVSDTRPAVKEEVMSLGAKFIEVEGAADASGAGGYAVEQSEEYKRRQQQRLAESVAKSDIIITTAQIPGKKAPLLITEAMLDSMRAGSVIIDLAASTGGNVAGTQNDTTVYHKGICIVGNSSLASDMPSDASKLYGKNVLNFMQLIMDKEGNLLLNFEDDIVKGSCVTHNGAVVHDRVLGLL
ncbi:Re/Si-specific NAD(P)(+) transhydrogenase subunit alpha [Sediminibacterium ginsengisoli]|uniref:NAD(P) transhydrogenase subunit alpha part 1 n=1 Tax=Sediminibacterium ginsengisoli TaxID=413434 RepID=A0A1T4KP29_9BACT|nr:Re/Si-specific NAD(P)(+) transhydrogenase subunit alpha [Sediminibacterium ginsengisoli]SJZ44172.1 NAD(P) transhydrogenase subunit alpha [Sediminibacterium ginsengisoli]